MFPCHPLVADVAEPGSPPMQNQLHPDEANYELAVRSLEMGTLVAPFDGVIANLFTHQGNSASASEAFCTVIDPQSLEVPI